MIRPTRSYAVLGITHTAFEEIRVKLQDAGYQDNFMRGGEIDMDGLAIEPESAPPEPVYSEEERLP